MHCVMDPVEPPGVPASYEGPRITRAASYNGAPSELLPSFAWHWSAQVTNLTKSPEPEILPFEAQERVLLQEIAEPGR